MTRAEHLRRLELVVQNTTNMVVVTNRLREIEWVNPAYTRVTGWTLEEVRGKNPRSFLHGPRTSLAAASRLGGRLRRGEAVADFEMLNYKKNGELYWVSLNIQPVVGEDGQVCEYVAIQTDITERKRAELEALRAHRRLAEAQHLARLGSIEHDLATGRIHCSPEVLRLVALEAGMAHARYDDMLTFVHPDDLAAVREGYEAAVNAGDAYEAELRVLARDGTQRWVHVRAGVQGWEDGTGALCRLAVQDITERKAAEQLAQEKALLENAARAQLDMLARVSHELRTPLHAVLGFAEMIERQEATRLAERSQAHLRHIRDAALHLLAIVNDILELTGVHAARQAMRVGTVDLMALAGEVSVLLEPVAAARQVRLQGPSAVAPLPALADRQRLLQVLINLVSNAIKYNRPGGTVAFAGRIDAEGRAALDVIDSGIGIPAHELPRLFEPFYRASVPGGEHAREAGGNGLGLPIARALAMAMHGDISVHSEPGSGSTFTLHLPRATATLAGTAATGVPPPVAASGVRPLLYIEDNEVNCLLIESFLQDRPDIALTCCATGAQGLATARTLQPALILIDSHLPDTTGAELVRTIRADPLLYRTPCIAFSADGDEQAVEHAIRAGFRGYLHKPVSRADFLALLDRQLAADAAARP